MIKDIIRTYGFHWVLLGLFIVICVFAGFVLFPAIVLTLGWNYGIVRFFAFFKEINIFAGILLWGIIAVTLYITTKEKFKISYEEGKRLSRQEIKDIVIDARKKGIPLKSLKAKLPKRKRK